MKSSPCAAKLNSSARPQPGQRAKTLGLSVSHIATVRAPANRAIAPAQNYVGENTDEVPAPDSCNRRAAALLTSEREALGLTLEEAAEAARVSVTTIWRRENGLVDLGPLKQLVSYTMARAKKERGSK